MKTSFNQAVSGLYDDAPVDYVVAAAFVAYLFKIYFGETIIKKLSTIILNNGDLNDAFAGLDESVKGWVCFVHSKFISCKFSTVNKLIEMKDLKKVKELN